MAASPGGYSPTRRSRTTCLGPSPAATTDGPVSRQIAWATGPAHKTSGPGSLPGRLKQLI